MVAQLHMFTKPYAVRGADGAGGAGGAGGVGGAGSARLLPKRKGASGRGAMKAARGHRGHTHARGPRQNPTRPEAKSGAVGNERGQQEAATAGERRIA